MRKIKYILCATGFFLFFITHTNIYSQCVQTEGPLDSLHIYFVASCDSIIFAGTNAGFFYTDSLPGQWKLLTRAKVSVYASKGDSVFSGGQSTVLIICDLSKPDIFADTAYFDMTFNSIHATDSFLYIGEYNFNRINLFDRSFDRFNEGLPRNEFHINSIAQIQNKLFCATNKGIYKAEDKKLIWSPINNGLPQDNVQMVKVIQDTLFAGINNNLYFSADTGTSWSLFFNAPSSVTSIMKNAGVYYISTLGNGIYSSPSDIIHWTTVNSGLTDLKATSLGSNKNTLICGTLTGGLFYKTDSNWVVNNRGMITTRVFSLTTTNSSIVAIDKYNNIYFSSNSNNWQNFKSNQFFHNYNTRFGKLCSVGDTLFISIHDSYTDIQHLFYTTDTGSNWSFVSNLPLGGDDPYSMRSENGRLYISEDGLTYYTDNMGTTWTEVTPSEILTNCAVESPNPYCHKSIQAFVLNANANWIKNINEFPQDHLGSFNFVANTEDALFTNIYLYVYVKSDTCPYWTRVANTPSFNLGIRSYAYTGKNLFISTMGYGVYYTDNYGISWKRLNTGSLDTNIIGRLAIKDSILYIGTSGSGVWKYDLNTLDFSTNAECPCNTNFIIPVVNKKNLHLYPNPASDYLYIQSDDSGIKETSIYDITGRLILYQKVDLDEPIDLRGFEEGIYFITSQTENEFVGGKFCVFH